MISNPGKNLKIICSLVILLAIALMPFVGMDDALAQDTNVGKSSNAYLVETFVDEQGRLIDKIIVPGRPPEIKAAVATVPESNPAMGANILSNVPAFDWSYGCSATSAAMLFGYYDNTGYSNMYAGPTNGGVCPMDNSVWGPGIGGSDGECPLSATHQGKDGRTTKGHVDDYWIGYASTAPDPFIDHWPEHTHGDCTGDFMGTNQSNFGNLDGYTRFYYFTNGNPLKDYILCEPEERDGCHGLRLFAESRGYTVVTNFNQYIYGYQGNTQGFTFSEFQSEIDAGWPVLIHVNGHTMLGYGYNTAGQIVYIHDTWDHSDHQMTWGSTYAGRQHFAVTVIRLVPTASPNNPPNTPSNPSPANHATGVPIDADLSWTGGDPDAGDTVTYDVYFGTGATPPLVSEDQTGTTYDPGTLQNYTTYYWKTVAEDNHAASTTGPVWDFTTGSTSNNPPNKPSPPSGPGSGDTGTSYSYSTSATDPDGDQVKYTFDWRDGITTETGFVDSGTTASESHTWSSPGTYYVKAKATDSEDASSGWSFSKKVTISAAPNNPPNTPGNPSPANHAADVPINADLSWTGGDPDAGDTVTYDVYFGTSSPPPFKETIGPYPATQSPMTYDPGALSYNTRYYWYVVATDNLSASTPAPLPGDVWDFSTAGEWDPWAYDENQDGVIQKSEATHAVQDYFGGTISKAQTIEVVMLYFG